jgi:hypothetical protein
MNSKKSDTPKDGAQEPKRVVKLSRPPPRLEKKPTGAKPTKAKPSAIYIQMGLALLLIAVLVIGVNQAMLFLMK